MKERNITENEVYEIFKNKILILKKNEHIIIGKTLEEKFLTLIINPNKHSLVTIWPSNRKERKLYLKKIGGLNEKK